MRWNKTILFICAAAVLATLAAGCSILQPPKAAIKKRTPAGMPVEVLPTGPGSDLKIYNYGVAAAKKKDFAKAERMFREATNRNPDLIDAWADLGAAQYKLGRFAESEATLRRCLRMDQRHKKALFTYGLVLAAKNEHGKSLAIFQKIAAREPKNLKAKSNMGAAYLALGRTRDAKKILHEVVEQDLLNVDAHVNLADIYLSEGKTDLALTILNNIKKEEPDNAHLHQTLGRCYVKKKDGSRPTRNSP